jgi:hypothetical protein
LPMSIPAQRSMILPITPPRHRRAGALSISCSTGFSHQSGDSPAPARYSFIRGVFPPFRQRPCLRRHHQNEPLSRDTQSPSH